MMEASEQGGHEPTPEEIAAKEAAAREAEAAEREAAESGNASGVAGSDLPAEGDAAAGAGEDGGDAEASDEAGSDERNPAADQSPVATEAQETIVGDQGTRDEQQPQTSEGRPAGVDTPVRTSAPPPEAQSGVPLPEDRAAGVEPGPSGSIAPDAPQVGGSGEEE